MGAYYGAIYDNVFHIRVMNKMLVHPLPYTFLTPAGKALVDAVPVAITLRQQSPLGAAAANPQHCLYEASALGFLTYVHVWAGAQELKNFRPLFVG
jgi:hypothetical protein